MSAAKVNAGRRRIIRTGVQRMTSEFMRIKLRLFSRGASLVNMRAIAILLGTLCATSALAVTYTIRPGYGGAMCGAVRDAFAEGLVVDSARPLCERRFLLSQKARSLSLYNVSKEKLPKRLYQELFMKMIAVTGNQKVPPSLSDQVRDKTLIKKLMESNTTIYKSKYDPDNSGKVKLVYIVDTVLCADKNDYHNGSVATYIKVGNGALDSSWGVYDQTAGIPFIYKKHTYYLTWSSLVGGDKNYLAEIDVADAVPYKGVLREISPYATLTPPECIIFQTTKRI